MTNDDLDQPEVLARAANELEAGAMVAALEDEGIKATAAGDFTAGFRVGAPGDVEVLVRRGDLPRARSILLELQNQSTPDDAEDDEDDADDAEAD